MKKIGLLLLIIIILLVSVLAVLEHFQSDVPLAENGVLEITREDMSNGDGLVSLKGDFLACDGIVTPEDFNDSSARNMTLEEIRLYNFPLGTLTAKLTVKAENAALTGIIIEEIYTANKVFINGKLVSSAGVIGSDRKSTVKEKKSVLLPLNGDGSTLEIVIQIGNFETISGQLERHMYVGDFGSLQQFYNLKLFIKLLCMGFFITVSFFLFALYIKNRKYGYLLTLSLAGLLNFYFLLSNFEPVVLFNLKDKAYLINSWLYTFPAVFVQFLCAMTVILFYQIDPIYKHRKKFIKINITAFVASVLILIIFDKTSYPIYFTTIIYTLGLIIYTGIKSGSRFVRGDHAALWVFASLFAYVFSFGVLMYITIDHNPYQTLGCYNIFTILPQVLFYSVLCYLTTTHFSRQFSITELSESELSKLVEEKNTQLQQSLDELKRKDKQRAEMLMNISHDLRSPMTVVKGYADLLNKGKIDQNEYQSYMEIIYNKVSYVIDLINELLDLANLETNKNIAMDADYIDSIIERVVAQYKGKDYTIIADIPSDTMVLCNGKNMFRLFGNLIDNAIEYSEKNAIIRILGEISDDKCLIRIKDNGRGIETKNLSYIFERFTTRNTQSNEHGNHFGLGLAICKAIVQNHNGTIDCTSILGQGTTFTIIFPLYKRGVDYEAADH